MFVSLYQFLYRFRNSNPVRLVAWGYLSYVLIGWVLLCLPVSMKSPVPPLDHLFTASSAVSTTGLTTVTVSERYTFFGQLVILGLIQLGGIGYMTFGSFVILSTRRVIEQKHKNLMQTVFSIPKEFRIEKFIVSVVKFTVLIEIVGAVALLPIFLRAGSEDPVWQAIFHSVSAFCTAGFGLFPDSFEGFKNDIALNAIISALSIIGAMGFIVCVDAWRVTIGKAKRLTLTSRIIIAATMGLLVIGSLLTFLTEPFGVGVGPGHRLLYAFFQVMTALTTVGFNTVPIGHLSMSVLVLLLVLMVIGASPSGTGGGLKTTTFSAILGLLWSTCRGERSIRFWGAEVPDERVRSAVAALSFYLGTLTLGTYLLTLTDKFSFMEILFENASALGTVGLSMGITSSLSSIGKFIIVLMMYIGRVGPLTLGMALFVKPELIFDDEKSDLAI